MREGRPLNLSVTQMLKFIEVGAKLEREARGGEDAPPEFQDIHVIFEGAEEAKAQ